MTITVENATWRGEPCYLVHANSHGTVDQLPIGTSVTGRDCHGKLMQINAYKVTKSSLRLCQPISFFFMINLSL